jgi:formylglycine-generating enzyme required for sulfatase activity
MQRPGFGQWHGAWRSGATGLKEVRPVFRQVSTVVLAVLVAAGSVAVVAAAEPKEADSKTKEPPKKLSVELGGRAKMEMTLIPAGEFKMGSGESAEDTAAFFKKTYGEDFLPAAFFKDEHPQHRVRITKPFYLGTYHVTRGQFRQFVADTSYKTDAEKAEKPGAYGWDPDKKEFGFNEKYSWRNAGFEQTDEHPVVNVSWEEPRGSAAAGSSRQGPRIRRAY